MIYFRKRAAERDVKALLSSKPAEPISAERAFRLKTEDSEPLSRYLPRKVLPISPGRFAPGAYSEGWWRVAQAQPDFPTIRKSKSAPARLTRIVHTTRIPVRHGWELTCLGAAL